MELIDSKNYSSMAVLAILKIELSTRKITEALVYKSLKPQVTSIVNQTSQLADVKKFIFCLRIST